MAREFDIRNEADTAAASRPSFAAVQREAVRVSDELPGAHRVAVTSADEVTGIPNTVVSVGAPSASEDLIAAALAHVQSIRPVLGLTAVAPAVEFRPDPAVLETSSGAAAVHLQQTVQGIAVFQAAQTVQFSHDRAIEATTGRSSTATDVAPAAPELSVEQAVIAAAEHLAAPDPGEPATDQFGESFREAPIDLAGLAPAVISSEHDAEQHTRLRAAPLQEPVLAHLTWFDVGGTLRLGWEVVLGLPAGGDHYRVILDAHDGQILYSHLLTAGVAARGNVFYPDGGSARQFRDFPLPLSSYPVPTRNGLPTPFPRLDWVAVDQTEGNNVRAHLNPGGTTSGSTVNSVMTFDPTSTSGNDQLRVNLFFFCNYMHDFLYLLGFREADGNFQTDNGGLGGVANDRVDANIYPGAVSGTANMYTPADGTAPTMNMGLVTSTNRHTALDSSVVFHEYTHGLSNRLVGGPASDHTLDAAQSASMGEGWSDFVACTINGTNVLGTWVVNNPRGIRGFAYDENFPDNFGMLGTGRYNEVHNNGEIWCASLMELSRRIGAALALQLVTDGLKLTPANPTYLQARDAILFALDNKARAEHWSGNVRRHRQHQAWRAFARFGMGPRATSGPSTGYAGITADFTIPRLSPRAGRFDGGRICEVLVSSPWGVGVWKLAGGSMSTPMMAPNGTRFGWWLLNTADNELGPVGDFDGDGSDEVLVSSPWGVGVWKLSGGPMKASM
ncbi:MAG: extracellular elastinolytic metalloproteinase [Pseudonocardiales bacterium]|nr:extracellular elastinolytic metalloproteinase [Pseudonocardiales bacterium]